MNCMRLKKFPLTLILLLCMSCAFLSASGKNVIPFSIRYGMPTVRLTRSDGTEFYFYITMTERSAISQRGLDRLLGPQETTLDRVMKILQYGYPDYPEEEIRNFATKTLKDGSCRYTVPVDGEFVTEGGLSCSFPGNVEIIPEKEAGKGDYDVPVDGLLNISFFGEHDNIIIDYVHKTIEFDGEQITGKAEPLRKIVDDGDVLYVTKLSINGIRQEAIIGTIDFFVLRDCYDEDLEYSDDEIVAFAKFGPELPDMPYKKKVRYELCGTKGRVVGYKSTDSQCSAFSAAKIRLHSMVNFIGYPIFKGHRIQLDFKNDLFRMD